MLSSVREMTKKYEIHLKWRECNIRVESIKQGGFWTGGSYEDKKKKNWGKAEGRLTWEGRECSGAERVKCGYELESTSEEVWGMQRGKTVCDEVLN